MERPNEHPSDSEGGVIAVGQSRMEFDLAINLKTA
jgi:hypothetical protein